MLFFVLAPPLPLKSGQCEAIIDESHLQRLHLRDQISGIHGPTLKLFQILLDVLDSPAGISMGTRRCDRLLYLACMSKKPAWALRLPIMSASIVRDLRKGHSRSEEVVDQCDKVLGTLLKKVM